MDHEVGEDVRLHGLHGLHGLRVDGPFKRVERFKLFCGSRAVGQGALCVLALSPQRTDRALVAHDVLAAILALA
eukprot:9159177-Heterocapsa_arctica.AAC.1